MCLAVPTVVGENILDVFLAVPTVIGENILGFFLFWELQGTDAAPRARMQRRGHMGRAHYGASQSRPTETKKIKSLRDLICFVCIIISNLVRRYLTFVATPLSNVRRDGVI